MTIVEICRVDDKKAQEYVAVAMSQGQDVRKFNSHYVVLLSENKYWHSEDAVFDSIPSGTYIFNKDNTVFFIS
jgi:hypothetical protein